MRCIDIAFSKLVRDPNLSRSRSSKQFVERLRASIEAVGLAEPIKVAALRDDKYLVVDGAMRLQAIDAIRGDDPMTFPTVPAYLVDFDRRFELRYQTDIYQDLLPSQLATLVEYLSQTEKITKVDIARYIGVSPLTVRNYTGLWRLVQRGGLFAGIVELMDVGVIPASNPFVWLRLTTTGIREVIEIILNDTLSAEKWIDVRVQMARAGNVFSLSITQVEAATTGLGPDCYREDEEVRNLKRNLGLRRAPSIKSTKSAVAHLDFVTQETKEPVLRLAARSLAGFLQ
jgi:hypothetical protein